MSHVNRLLFSQIVSLLGSAVARFGLGVWVYEKTGSFSDFAMITLTAQVPSVIIGPMIGPLIDRWHKKTLMLVSDALAAVASVSLLLLYWAENLSVPAVVVGVTVASLAEVVQWPSFSSSLILVAEKKHLPRVNGIIEIGRSVSMIAAPALGGVLLTVFGLSAVFFVEFTTFAFSILVMLTTIIPRVQRREEQSHYLEDIKIGLRFIAKSKLFIFVLLLFAAMNFFVSLVTVLLTPHALELFDSTLTGFLMGTIGLGMILAGALFSTFNPRRLVASILLASILLGVALGSIGLFSNLLLVFLAFFLVGVFVSWVNISNQLIWQLLTPAGLQGRVFSLRRAIGWVFAPLGTAAAIPLSAQIGKVWGTSHYGGAIFMAGALFFFVVVIFGLLSKPYLNFEIQETSEMSS